MFTRSLEEGKLPPEWKKAKVTAVYKKGSKQDPGNYRPISLTSVVGKLMEKCIRDSLMNHLKNNKLLSDVQYGFRPGRSCQLQLLETIDKWSEEIDQSKSVDVIFLDFSKAFDSVPHTRLLTKLKAYGITGSLYRWLEDFVSGRTQQVSVQGAESEWVPVTSGVPQGSVLGPILFLLYVNDLPDSTQNWTRLFADDTKVSIGFLAESECDSLQDDITKLTEWSKTWQLSFNAKKCKVMHIGSKNPHHKYHMKDQNGQETEITSVTEEKDLGVVVDSRLSFKSQVASVVKKANSMTGILVRNFKHLDPNTFTTLYKAIVRPVIEYGSPVWAPHTVQDQDRLEGVQRRATRSIKLLKKKPYHERLKSLGVPTLSYRRDRADMIQVYKLVHGLEDIDPNELITRDTDRRTRGHPFKLKKERCESTKRSACFRHRVVNNWNSLPEYVVTAQTLNSFKTNINKAWRDTHPKFTPIT